MSKENTYPLIESDELQPLVFVFISKGNQDTIKIVQYAPSQPIEGKKVYNLGFGDYDIETSSVIDDNNTNNGDVYKVFNTVLSTIPLFFQNNPNDLLIVRGSDSNADFVEKCKISCKKNCQEVCKNYNRRITLYLNYVNKNHHLLSKEFIFFGGIETNDKRYFEEYVPYKPYSAVLLQKIKL